MNRRSFLRSSTASAAFLATWHRGIANPLPARTPNLDVNRHRFGVNYTPSHDWWFCWNNWNPSPIERDLDAIASLHADHMRIMLIWPYFQPNLTWVDPRMIDRLHQLISLMQQRHLDALITVFTGQLSGWFFLPPFNKPNSGFYTDPKIKVAQLLLIQKIAAVVRDHPNVIGLDLGNELNTCWRASTNEGDAWMQWIFAQIDQSMPGHLNVNGVDQQPWFSDTTFSPEALVTQQRMPVMHCYPYWSGALQYGGAMDPPSTKLLAAMATLIRSYASSSQLPVWAGEFNTCIPNLTQKQQAQWLQLAVTNAIQQGVNWFTYWDSHDLDPKFSFNQVEYSLGLLTNNNQVKEQGHAFRELALAYAGKPVVYPTGSLPAPPTSRNDSTTWQWMLDWMKWNSHS